MEPNVAIISACLPMLRPMFKPFSLKVFSSYDQTAYSSRNGASGTRPGGLGVSSLNKWRHSSVPIVEPQNGGIFSRLYETGTDDREHSGGSGSEEWKMQSPPRSLEPGLSLGRTQYVGREDVAVGGEEEAGGIVLLPDKIYIRNDINVVDDNRN